MNAISISAKPVNAEVSEKREPYLYLSGSQITDILGDFTFEKGVRYEVPLTFEVTEWRKDPDGEESITLCIKEGGEAQEVGRSTDKEEEPAEEKPAKVTVKAAKVSEY